MKYHLFTKILPHHENIQLFVNINFLPWLKCFFLCDCHEQKHPIIFESINEENLFHNLWRTNMYHHSMYSILLIISQYIIVLVKYLLFSYFFVVSESVIVRNSLCPLCCAWILGSVVNQYSIYRSWWWNNRCWLYCRVLFFAIKVLPHFTHNSREKNGAQYAAEMSLDKNKL